MEHPHDQLLGGKYRLGSLISSGGMGPIWPGARGNAGGLSPQSNCGLPPSNPAGAQLSGAGPVPGLTSKPGDPVHRSGPPALST